MERSTEHRAKFRADRPTELGDYAARKKRKNHSKTEVLPKTIVFGRTNKASMGWWRGAAVMHFIRTTKLLYTEPG